MAARAQQTRFDGYKLSAAATNTPMPLITAVEVAPAPEQDGPQAKHLIDVQPAARRPHAAAGRHRLRHRAGPRRTGRPRHRGARPGPRGTVRRRPARQARLHHRLGGREGDLPGRPQRADPHRPSGQRRALFARPSAAPARCASAASARASTRQISCSRPTRAADRRPPSAPGPVRAEHLRRTRPRIERLLGLLAHRYSARKSRYIGRRKARLQAAWTAALVNLNPIGRHLNTQAT